MYGLGYDCDNNMFGIVLGDCYFLIVRKKMKIGDNVSFTYLKDVAT